ncbi:MAG: alpha/beta hydrolase-fold protein [Spirosomaceae bacterium]|nr:alpha/beta hydrolase-fold protein [Spirosomataceae bacterium]
MNYLKFIPHIGLFVFLLPIKVFSHLTKTDTTLKISIHHDTSLHSQHLRRDIVLDIVLPPSYSSTISYPVLYMNDGQDLTRLNMKDVLQKLYQSQSIMPFILVAIHCGDRLQEYGVAAEADYKQRGAKAKAYTDFVLKELRPYIAQKYPVSQNPAQTVFCGFSLGGLSAFDIVWQHPEIFGKVGVFSGSFWWRSRAYENHYDDYQDRIMQRRVRESGQFGVYSSQFTVHSLEPNVGSSRAALAFWLQTGTEDEKDDRNDNGIIDSIEDTLDLIGELEKKGYRWGKEIRYVEVKNGKHDQATWSAIMPDFLTWAFGIK